MPDLAVPINYVAAGELPPHPLTPAQKAARRENAENCACPFLKTAYVEGQIEANEAGYATIDMVYNVMDWAGIGRMAFPQEGYLTKFGISGVPILHLARNRPNDSGILHAYIGEEERLKRLDDFLSYANDDGIFTRKEFEDAADSWCMDGPGGCDSLFAPRGEFATIVTAFGRTDKSQYYLTKEDVKNLFYDNVWPRGFESRRRPEKAQVTMVDVTMFYRFMKMKKVEEANVEAMGHGVTIPADDQGYEMRPWPNPPVSDMPNGTLISPEEIKTLIPGGKMCIWDSRWSGIQPVVNHTRWVFTPDMYQTTTEELLGPQQQSSGPPVPVVILVVAAIAYFFVRRINRRSDATVEETAPILP